MEEIGSTSDNLQAPVTGETYEFKDTYPPMFEPRKICGAKADAFVPIGFNLSPPSKGD